MIAPTSTVPIQGVRIARTTIEQLIKDCAARLQAGQGGYCCFVNVHLLGEAARSPKVAQALNEATFSVADGLPLVWASRLLHRLGRLGRDSAGPLPARVCGPDFMVPTLTRLADQAHGFIGGSEGQAQAIAKKFGLGHGGAHAPAITYVNPIRPFSEANAREDWAEFLKRCPSDGSGGQVVPRLVWVGLGAPKQERWMHTVAPLAPQTIFFGVGAAFDFLTDSKRRAPLWMQRMGLEWLFRLASEPRRLAGRYLSTNTRFVVRLLVEAFYGHTTRKQANE